MKKITLAFFAMCLLWSMDLTAQKNIRGLAIYIDFPDASATLTANQMDNILNGVNYSSGVLSRSIRDYWLEQSHGELNITHEVITYRAPNTIAYYNDLGFVGAKQELLRGALDHVAALHPNASWWNQFHLVNQNDIPSGQDDGYFTSINFLFSDWVDALGNQSHQMGWDAPNGKRTRKISNFNITPQFSPGNFGIMCHEMGHSVFGWGDLYDGNGGSKGAGIYTIMAASSKDMEPVGAPYWEQMGWGNPTTISGTQTITLTMDGSGYARLIHPQNPREHFIIEARSTSTDGNERLGASGLVIWHVDRDGDNDDEQMTPSEHYSHAVEQADGDFELEKSTSQGGNNGANDAGDIYVPGKSFTDTTTPNSKWWDGSSSGLSITNIQISGNQVTFTASDGTGGCTPPNVSISPSSPTINEGSSVTLTASGASSYTWSNGLGSGSTKTVSPSTTTTYTVTGTSNGCSSTESVTVTVTPSGGGGGTTTVSRRIASGSDDAEESESGAVSLSSSDIELVRDGGGDQTVGLRFTNLNIPQGATIVSADVQFTTDEINTGTTNLTIRGHDSNNSATFSSSSGNISSRGKTSASVSWSPSAWNSVGQAGSNQRTPDISSVIQEIVDRSGFSSSSAISIIITGSGERTAESYNGSSSQAPLLTVEYSTGSGGGSCDPSNLTPYFQINSGSWQQGTTVSLNAGDDLRFGPQPVSGSWSWSGPNGYSSSQRETTVNNVDSNDAGNYVATYTNSCGAQSSVTFNVSVAGSGGGGGGTTTVSRRIASGADDAEEESSGAVDLTSTDIELVDDKGDNQTIGLRFTNLNIPQGATIVSADVQFTTDETNTGTTNLTIRGHDSNNSGTFSTLSGNISSRGKTSASVSWSPSSWNTVGQAGSNQRTPDISSVIQEIVDRSGFSSSSAISIIITGSGERTAESYEGSSSKAALLTVEYTGGGAAKSTSKEKLDDEDIIASVSVYPNPVDDVLTLKMPKYNSVVEIVMYDIRGSILKRAVIDTGQSRVTISTSDLKSGLYFLNINSEKESVLKKIIKK